MVKPWAVELGAEGPAAGRMRTVELEVADVGEREKEKSGRHNQHGYHGNKLHGLNMFFGFSH